MPNIEAVPAVALIALQQGSAEVNSPLVSPNQDLMCG